MHLQFNESSENKSKCLKEFLIVKNKYINKYLGILDQQRKCGNSQSQQNYLNDNFLQNKLFLITPFSYQKKFFFTSQEAAQREIKRGKKVKYSMFHQRSKEKAKYMFNLGPSGALKLPSGNQSSQVEGNKDKGRPVKSIKE